MKPIRAVHDDDLDAFLESIGLKRKFQAGELKCKFCGDPITGENLLAILPQSGTIHVVCSKPSCQQQLGALIAPGDAKDV